jgi:hypothetical protein
MASHSQLGDPVGTDDRFGVGLVRGDRRSVTRFMLASGFL